MRARLPIERTDTVLIAEDDQVTCGLVAGALESAGFLTIRVNDGIDAMNFILESRPAAIVLDMDLPRLHGREICALVRKSLPVQHTPIVVISGRACKSDKLNAFDLGADDYVTKPFSLEELVARVDAVLHRSRQRIYPTPFLAPHRI